MMGKPTIYIASRTVHAPKWLALREEGYNINSTWIDEAGPGQSVNLLELICRCVTEAKTADCLILYSEAGDHLKCALVETGAALAANKMVYVVGEGPSLSPTMLMHPNVISCATMKDALDYSEMFNLSITQL